MNWLLIAVLAIFLLGFFIGWHRGAIRMTVSMAAAVLTIFLAWALSPYVTDVLKNHTGVYDHIRQGIESSIEEELGERAEGLSAAGQAQFIEELPLPNSLKEALRSNNNSEIRDMLGVDTFVSYIGGYLASLAVNVIGFILTFILSFFILRLLGGVLNLVSRLPLIHGLNKIAGAVMGLLEGLIVVWLLGLVITMAAGTSWGQNAMELTGKSQILTFLYDHNLFVNLILGLF